MGSIDRLLEEEDGWKQTLVQGYLRLAKGGLAIEERSDGWHLLHHGRRIGAFEHLESAHRAAVQLFELRDWTTSEAPDADAVVKMARIVEPILKSELEEVEAAVARARERWTRLNQVLASL